MVSLSLVNRAQELFPQSPNLQLKWLKAVSYLRNESKIGWLYDRWLFSGTHTIMRMGTNAVPLLTQLRSRNEHEHYH
jgi:hypothetical protein